MEAAISKEREFYATQTIVPGLGPDSTTVALALTEDEALKKQYKDNVVRFIATQTFMTGKPRESFVRDVEAYKQIGGANGCLVAGGWRSVLVAVVVAFVGISL